jgi:exosortase
MMKKKDWLFALMTAAALAMAFPALFELLSLKGRSEEYSHIVLIPIVSAYVLYRRRSEIFAGRASAHPWGMAAVAAGLGIWAAGTFSAPGLDVRASLATLGALLFWWGGYVMLYGKDGSRRAVFPLAFLLFAVPIPPPVMEKVIAVLVVGSACMTRLLFVVLGVPFVQEGPTFHLPGFAIEVAQECSGIRSSLALLITTILAGHIFLRKFGSRMLLVLAVMPVALFKNAVRIVALYLLSYFVDIRIIAGGFLHRSGGFVFFGLGLVVLGAVLWLLRQGELVNSEAAAAGLTSNNKKKNEIASRG